MTGFVRAVSIVAAAAVVVSSVAVMVAAVVVGMTGHGLPWWQVGACVVVGVDGFAAMLAGVGWLARLFPVARPAPPVEVWAVSDEEWEPLGPAAPTPYPFRYATKPPPW